MSIEIYDQSEAFVEEDGDLVFDHTKVILKKGGDLFYARTNQRQSATIDLNQLEAIPIPKDHIYPAFNPIFTQAPNPLPPKTYVKRPNVIYYGDTTATMNFAPTILNEVNKCEVLRRHPHPNIAQYLGCLVEGGRIYGICFVEYQQSLAQRLREKADLNVDGCIRGIENGVNHLHSLGLIHCDLNPQNIMMNDDDPVIIDFDSCTFEGEPLGLKAGTEGWADSHVELAKRKGDLFSLSKIKEALVARTRERDSL